MPGIFRLRFCIIGCRCCLRRGRRRSRKLISVSPIDTRPKSPANSRAASHCGYLTTRYRQPFQFLNRPCQLRSTTVSFPVGSKCRMMAPSRHCEQSALKRFRPYEKICTVTADLKPRITATSAPGSGSIDRNNSVDQYQSSNPVQPAGQASRKVTNYLAAVELCPAR